MIKYEQKFNFFNFPLFFISQLNNNFNNNNEYEKLKILYNEEKKNSII